MAEDREKSDLEHTTADLQKRIADAFDIFDHESNKTVDVREIGTIVRSLNCCPSEGELSDILSDVEEEEPTGYIRFEKFEPVMMKILLERKYKPANEEQLLKAFSVLDQESKGFLTVDELQKLMTEEGEPFTQEEMEEMLSAAVDPDKGIVYYKDYLSLMAIDDS
ncbi:dynein regulatory complex protein 8-like [Rhopilema esculentum]|uniref:dynein regulatory complex protein 8-like n=1 Tax=Rhopilema esculentum TaxID=499914 RepID=UPI0031D8634E|eukprot:gene13397-4260_t